MGKHEYDRNASHLSVKLFQRILAKRARDPFNAGNQSELESHDRQTYITACHSQFKRE